MSKFMKPCWRNRKRIAALVLGELGADEAHELRRHFESCESCRHGFEELAGIRDELTASAPRTEVTPSADFHRRVMRALRKQSAGVAFGFRTSQLEIRRLGLAFGLVLAGALLFWAVHEKSSAPGRNAASPPAQPILARVRLPEPPAPTIGNYRDAAERSLDALDELVTEQALRCSPAAPIYTASTLAWLNLPN